MKTYCLQEPNFAHNEEIKPLQKALKAAGLYGGPIDGTFGNSTAQACYRAKYRLGYPKSAVNQCGGQTLLDYLRGSKKLPPLYIVRRHARGYGITKAEQQRQLIVEYALWGVRNNGAIHYRQYRPMDELNKVKGLPWYSDCSEFVTTIYKWAGAPDPNGWRYNGYGNTDTLINHGSHVALWDAKPADLVIWAWISKWGLLTHHVAVIVDTSNRSDPKLVSLGSEIGPVEISLSQETVAQHGRSYFIRRYLGD